MNKKFKLYPHNEKAYAKIEKAFHNDQKIVGLVHATGTGKAYIALQYALLHQNEKIIYVVPSRSIIEHLIDIINREGFTLEKDFAHVSFRTYQNFINYSAEEMAALAVDVLILDEFHHLGAPVWGARMEYLINSHPQIKVIGLTAYTIRDRGTIYERDMANPRSNELFSNKIISRYDLVDAMIDKTIPKPIYKTAYINLLEFYHELEQKLKTTNIKKETRDLCTKILKDLKKRVAEAPGLALIMQKNIKPNGKYIYYCPPFSATGVNDIATIKAEAFEWFKEFIPPADICFYTTTSEMGKKGQKNREAFYHDQDLEGHDVSHKLRVMFAINQYNEGLHAPNIDGVILGRGTSSDIVFFEQIGRALAVRGDSKEQFHHYENYSLSQLRDLAIKRNLNVTDTLTREDLMELLVAPLIIDLTNNYDFMKTLETNLKTRLREKRERQDSDHREIYLENANFDLEIENKDIFEMLNYVRDSLGFKWEDYYELLLQYQKENGNVDVPRHYETKTGIKLGNWCYYQKVIYHNGTLLPSRIKLLKELNFQFQIINKRYDWLIYYEELKKYYEKYGNVNVPSPYETKTGLKLGTWVRTQRDRYALGKLASDRLALLQKLDFHFARDFFAKAWEKGYAELVKFYDTYGHCNVPAKYITPDGYKLGSWVVHQKRNLNTKLSSEQIARLNSLSFEPSRKRKVKKVVPKKKRLKKEEPRENNLEKNVIPEHDLGKENTKENWYQQLLKVVNFIAQNERLPQESDDAELSYWLEGQKKLAALGKLPKEQEAYLQGIGVLKKTNLSKK